MSDVVRCKSVVMYYAHAESTPVVCAYSVPSGYNVEMHLDDEGEIVGVQVLKYMDEAMVELHSIGEVPGDQEYTELFEGE